MWESPIYKLNQPYGKDKHKNALYREIVIDVTKSAPNFSAPQKALRSALTQAIAETKLKKSAKILDFGSGKLRNALYLLGRGYNVCSVEYESMFVESKQAAAALLKAKRYKKKFSTLLYPHQFTACKDEFDLALLINVMNIMPIPPERLLVLNYCNKRLRPGGHLLWYTQRGDAAYAKRQVPEYQIGDGYYVGIATKYKKFYREYTVAEIDALLTSAGFQFVLSIDATWRNQARLYRKVESAPLAAVLSASDIKSARVVDEKIPLPTEVNPREVVGASKRKGNPDPDKLKPENLHIMKLRSIPLGARHATEYQEHVKKMLELLFFPKELRNLKLEVKILSARKRLDIRASNKSKSGFFYSLRQHHDFVCPTIIIECKNYGHELKNPEFDQLGSRLGKKLGYVGILAFRKATNYATVIDRCRDFFNNEEKIILPLRDSDFETLLTLKMQGQDDDIETYLDELLFQVKAG